MNSIELLLQRQSTPAKQLQEPAPTPEQLQTLLQAACSVPDHGGLQPYRFLQIAGQQREQLGEVFAQAVAKRQPGADAAVIEKQRSKPNRAPLIISVIATLEDHPKIPEIEQLLCAGAAAEHLMLAANLMGFGSVWLTGDNAYDWSVCEALGLRMNERIIGFIYLGTTVGALEKAQRPAPKFTIWEGPQALDSAI